MRAARPDCRTPTPEEITSTAKTTAKSKAAQLSTCFQKTLSHEVWHEIESQDRSVIERGPGLFLERVRPNGCDLREWAVDKTMSLVKEMRDANFDVIGWHIMKQRSISLAHRESKSVWTGSWAFDVLLYVSLVGSVVLLVSAEE